MLIPKPFQQLGLALAFLTLTGCVSARVGSVEADRQFRRGDYSAAANTLQKELDELGGPEHRDGLLYLMDLGLALHSAKDLEKSNKVFLEAEKIADIKDYTSLATQGGTLLTGENITQYKGEDFEKVLINTYLAVNYAELGQWEDAQVEARKVNRKLRLMITEGNQPYQLNAFARYLSGVLFEAGGEWQDAYIDYKKTMELDHQYPHLGRDLYRVAKHLGYADDAARWARKFSLSEEDKRIPGREKAEIIVVFENGISPVKRPNPQFNRVPAFFPRNNPVSFGEVLINGTAKDRTYVLHDIEHTAIQNLQDKYAALVAKRMAGIVVKEVVAHQVEKSTDSPILGLLTRVILHASDQADLRSWNLLPKDLQIARFFVDPGEYHVTLKLDGSRGQLPDQTVHLEKGQKKVMSFRYIPSF